jgi:hypothetical protein
MCLMCSRIPPPTNTSYSINGFTPQYCWLDYLPHLRLMAQREFIADKNYAEIQVNDDDDGEFQSKRRRTRRNAPQGRTHHFDLVLGTSQHTNEKMGKAIGEELATMRLQYNANN